MNKFLPGDIVRYGFGMIKGNHYESHNVICITDVADGIHRYKAIWLAGDCSISFGEYTLEYNCLDTELLHTAYPEKHTLKVTKL